nr:NAD(P)-binding protein [Dietzia sp. Die43]
MINTPRGPVEQIDLVVVGAGFGGIAMADRLLGEGRGRDFLVLEAADSVGGHLARQHLPGVRLRRPHRPVLAVPTRPPRVVPLVREATGDPGLSRVRDGPHRSP